MRWLPWKVKEGGINTEGDYHLSSQNGRIPQVYSVVYMTGVTGLTTMPSFVLRRLAPRGPSG
jgi:hypothetical protein